MPFADVWACIPRGIVPNPPETLAYGLTEQLRLVEVQFGPRRFSVGFYFLHDRLQQVLASLTNVRSFLDVMLTFSSLQTALRSAYGPEETCTIEEEDAEAAWECQGTEIRLLACSFDRDHGFLNLITRPVGHVAEAVGETADEGVVRSLKSAEAVEGSGLPAPALDLYEMIEAECVEAGSKALMVRCLFGKARVLRVLGRVVEARIAANMALAFARSIPSDLATTIECFVRELPDTE